jgi:hypothetical protein
MSDPTSVVGAAYRYANSQTPLAVIALAGLLFFAWLWMTTLQTMARDLRDHVKESGWYQHQSCISLAELAGTRPELCDSAHDDRR